MIPGRVSVIIPARNEAHLQKTVTGLLTNAAGDLEVIVVLDGGPWPDPPLDPRAIVVRHNEPRGMRPSINEAAEIASGQYLMKCDGHMIFGEGYDEIMKADCAEDWLVVPTRHSIDAEAWERGDTRAAVKPRHFNYHTLSYPFLPSMYGEGLHAVTFSWDQNKSINMERKDVLIDDLLSFQGSCWFQPTKNFLADGPLDHEAFYFYGESQETGLLRYWLRGRRCVITKKTFGAHFHKGKDNKGADGRRGRGFYLDVRKKRQCEARITEFCINNTWPGQTRTFESLVEQFWPLISQMKDPQYAWPSDWADWEKYRTWFKNRSSEVIPAHT